MRPNTYCQCVQCINEGQGIVPEDIVDVQVRTGKRRENRTKKRWFLEEGTRKKKKKETEKPNSLRNQVSYVQGQDDTGRLSGSSGPALCPPW